MNEDPKVLFGRRLRELRMQKNWSQEYLAFEAGLDRTYIGGIENGKRNVSLVNICRLAKALGTTPSDLIDFAGTTEETIPQDPKP